MMDAEKIRARVEKTHDKSRLQALALKLVADVERLERRLQMSQLKEMAALNRAAELQSIVDLINQTRLANASALNQAALMKQSALNRAAESQAMNPDQESHEPRPAN